MTADADTSKSSIFAADAAAIRSLMARRKGKRVYVTLQDLQDAVGTRDQARLYAAILPQLDAGLLQPLKSAKSNGSRVAPLFEKYRIVVPAPPRHDLTQLHPLLLSTGYLERQPARCDEHWNELLLLTQWLSSPDHNRDATLRERCWEVFGDEKAYESSCLRACIYHACGHDLRDVLVVLDDEPEELPFVVRRDPGSVTSIVVCENRDPYLSIRRGLLAGSTTLFGQPVDAVVYGRGDMVRQAGGASLRRALESMHADPSAVVWYWGDVDREGLAILVQLVDAGIARPFVPAYDAMLVTTDAKPPRPSPDGRDRETPDIEGLFAPELTRRLDAIARAGRLLPQEVLSAHAIRGAMA